MKQQNSKDQAEQPKPDKPEKKQVLQPTAVKAQDPSNKYSFSSYHMNIISGNRQVQTMPRMQQQGMYPTQMNQMPNGQMISQGPPGDFQNYYLPQGYSQQSQYMTGDIQQVLNNMYMALSNQSKLLSYLVEKNETNIETTAKIYQEMAQIRQEDHSERKEQVQQTESGSRQLLKQVNIGSDITASDLVSILYGQKTQFKYKLIMDKECPLEKILYRERNFKLKVNLIDDNNKPFKNSNKIPISLALYTVENPPKFLESNTLGNKMLKGYTEQDLVDGTCVFDKIQIKEVTSHYRKGMLFLVAFAKMPSFGAVQDANFVEYTSIHPLVVDKVIVKAKKMKEDQGKEPASQTQMRDREDKDEKDDKQGENCKQEQQKIVQPEEDAEELNE